MQTWLKTVSIATQQEIHNPYANTRVRGTSISHGISVIKSSITTSRSKSRDDINTERKVEEIESIYYKPICWNERELKNEAGDAFSNKLQLQEVYTNDNVEVSFFDPARQGWRVLGGTINDILTWCILTSEINDKRK